MARKTSKHRRKPWTGAIHDRTKPSKATRPKKALRASKDKSVTEKLAQIQMTFEPIFTGEDPPWILKPTKNWVSGLRNADKIGINPKDALGAAKVPMHLVPPASVILQALCMDDGNIKYGPYNVRMEPIQAIGYIAAAKRHLDAYLDGQDYDPVTGKPHLGYALATIGLIIDAWLGGTLIDNRPVPGVGGQLLDALAMKPDEQPRSPNQLRAIFESIAQVGKNQTQERFRCKC